MELLRGIQIVILAKKEEDNLKILIPKIKNTIKSIEDEVFSILIVDTNPSLDKTKEFAQKEGLQYINQVNIGFGGAMVDAIKFCEYDRMIFLDADGAHDPVYIKD